MNGSTPIDDQLLAKYVAGEADAAERAAVEQWAVASDANTKELERMRAVWDWSGDGTGAEVDVDAAWKRVSVRMDGARDGGRVVPMRTWDLRRWVAAAALVAGLVFAVRLWMAPGEKVFLAGADHLSVKLTDSSAVVLSPGSRIAATMGGGRKVTLNGEAYFDVHHDPERPFIVHAGAIEVTVLGTVFTVSAYDTSRVSTVRVREGRVRVVAEADTLVLIAGQHARFDRVRHLLEREAAPPVEVWGERIIQFEEAPLSAVIARLQELFPVRIELGDPAMANCRLTATFEDEPIGRILDVIAQTYGFTIMPSTGDTYVLQGDGCE